MVFVVLEGEITVILHTTQFNAKKGDSFYIPPKVSFFVLRVSAHHWHQNMYVDYPGAFAFDFLVPDFKNYFYLHIFT